MSPGGRREHRVTLLPAGLGLALVSVMLLAGGCGDSSEQGAVRRADDCSTEGKLITKLKPVQERRVLEILREDPTLHQITGGVHYRVKSIGPWSTASGTELEGGFAILRVKPPISFAKTTLPFTVEPPSGVPDPDPCLRYLQRTVPVSAREVTEIMALVDLGRQEVASLDAGGNTAKVEFGEPSGPEPSDVYDEVEGY